MPNLNNLATNGQPLDSRASDDRNNDVARRLAWAASLTHADWESLRRVLDSLGSAEVLPDTRRLIIKSSRRLIFLDTAQINWIEASGNYVRFHLGSESHAVRAGIGRIAERLNPAEFVRIHRSTVVNIAKIKELETCDNGEYLVVLKDGKKLPCSRGYCGRLQQMIKRGYAF